MHPVLGIEWNLNLMVLKFGVELSKFGFTWILIDGLLERGKLGLTHLGHCQIKI